MNRVFAAAIALLGMAGCLETPQTPDDVRSHSWTTTSTITVNRSVDTTISTVSRRARTCLNFGVTTQWIGPAMLANVNDSYRTSRQGNSLIMEHFNPDNIGSPGWYPYIVADVAQTGAGTTVTTYAGPGNGVFVEAIQSWANGDMSPCPADDLFG